MPNFFSISWNDCVIFFEIISFLLSVTGLSFLFFYYIYFFLKLCFHKSVGSSFTLPVSIIICAKNELNNLRQNLPVILAQNYFNFEVIVVNDQSNDESKSFLDELATKNKHLVIVDIDDFVKHAAGKKFALTLGVKTAKHEYLILTDADCMPNSKDWVKQMTSNFNHHNIVLGYGPYEKKKGLLNKIIRFDTFNVAQQYLSFALAGQAYMGIGRNLAYKKSLFFDNKGFASHIHIPSGDDDLFIQEIAQRSTVGIEISEVSHTTSDVMQSWKDWIYQKRRHLSTAPFYQAKFKILLALYPLAQFIFFTGIIVMIILKMNLLYIMILLVLKLLLSYLVNYRIMKLLNVYDLYWLHPVYEAFHLLIQGNFVLLNLIRKPKKWSR